MSNALTVTITGADFSAEELALVAGALNNPGAMNARMAGDCERWIKGPAVAGKISASHHRTALALGAKPTEHLTKAYQQIEGTSDTVAARLLIPRSSRLRAAFGPYTVRPVNGKKYLTIAANREAYGRRAGEFGDQLFPVQVGGKGGAKGVLTLSKRRAGGGLEVMYVLVPSATIPEDPTLIPFDELGEVAKLAIGDYIDDALEATLPPA